MNELPLQPPKRRQLRMLRPHLDDLPSLVVPAGYQLRTYRPGDEAAWAEIMASSDGLGRDWTVEKVRERMMLREQFEAEGMFFATCDAEDGRPVASATAWRTTERSSTMGNVHMVCALDTHRGRGVGRLVTLATLYRLRSRGHTAADLSTDDFRLAAIKSYLGLGFVPIYFADPGQVDDHQARWSAILSRLFALAK